MSGMFSLISAGKTLERHMESTSNNLANANTAGYKADQPTFKEVLSGATKIAPESEQEQFLSHEYLDLYVGMDKSSVAIDSIGKNYSAGPMRSTQNPLDIALENEGFFTVSTPQGDRYTRAGSFTLNDQGQMITQEGFQVLGQNGPIAIEGNDIKVDENGGVHVDGGFVDKLNLVEFRSPQRLQKLGRNLFAPVDNDNVPLPSDKVKVRQGMVEESNVSSVKEMVGMIGANRTYEAVMKAMKNINRLDEQAISLTRMG